MTIEDDFEKAGLITEITKLKMQLDMKDSGKQAWVDEFDKLLKENIKLQKENAKLQKRNSSLMHKIELLEKGK